MKELCFMDETLNNNASVTLNGHDDRKLSHVESTLEALGNGQLAQRIAQAARLAVAKHMLENAQAFQNFGESEYSSK